MKTDEPKPLGFTAMEGWHREDMPAENIMALWCASPESIRLRWKEVEKTVLEAQARRRAAVEGAGPEAEAGKLLDLLTAYHEAIMWALTRDNRQPFKEDQFVPDWLGLVNEAGPLVAKYKPAAAPGAEEHSTGENQS